nr:immunoglobulin heavy chain junction region [Mus musculus]
CARTNYYAMDYW